MSNLPTWEHFFCCYFFFKKRLAYALIQWCINLLTASHLHPLGINVMGLDIFCNTASISCPTATTVLIYSSLFLFFFSPILCTFTLKKALFGPYGIYSYTEVHWNAVSSSDPLDIYAESSWTYFWGGMHRVPALQSSLPYAHLLRSKSH